MSTRISPPAGWRFAADRGGTFTDVLGIGPDGALHAEKLPSRSPAYADAVAEGMRRVLARAGDGRAAGRVVELRVGTTVATNALLERRGARVALAVTAGFEDLLAIGHQARPELFALDIVRPQPLYGAVAGVAERLDAAGRVVTPLDAGSTLARLRALRRAGHDALAVVLLHAWANPAHERAVADLARRAGFAHVTLSHAVSGRIRVVERGQAAVVDAALTPVLRAYLDALGAALDGLPGPVPVQVMQSDGALIPAARASGRAAVLSGPAGGAMAVSALARALRTPVLGFDMGGTSTDVCRCAPDPERTAEVGMAGTTFQADALRIETVAAGGGSVLALAGTRLTVGPRSAGADPGPACYGRGGPATLTDAQLVLGRLDPAALPRAFGPHGDARLDAAAARRALADLARAVRAAGGPRMSVQALALGYLAVADEQMAAPMRALSTARGHDARTHVLVPFGGAGGLHACAIARLLGIRRVVAEPLAGLYSALGIARAARQERAARSVLRTLDARGLAHARTVLDALTADAAARLGPGPRRVRRLLELRPAGAEGVITLPLAELRTLRARFDRAWRARHGYAPPRTLEIAAAQISVTRPAAPAWHAPAPAGPARLADRRVVLADGPRRVPVYRRGGLAPGTVLHSPCVVRAPDHTLVVEADFTARVDAAGRLVLERGAPPVARATRAGRARRRPDPVLLELWNRRLRGLAAQMGAALVASAHSVNMKERLDFSCAVFDAAGRLVANAPHIPVHLGAMGESVRNLLGARGPRLRPGQVWLGNHPGHGGSHLPDLTVITPVFRRGAGRSPAWFVATRGHHADIGGPEPGSMSPFAPTLRDEGVVFEHFLAVDAGRLRERAFRTHLASGPYPARNPDERLADLRAMLAANRLGERGLLGLAGAHGARELDTYMAHLRAHTAAAVRAALAGLLGDAAEHTGACTDALDDGTPVACALRVARAGGGAHLHVDFTGTGPRHAGSFNAPRAVVRSAVLYVLRCLVGRDIPLNEGAFDAVTLRVPPGSLLDPPADAAVVAGNVETAQRVVDVLLGALGVAAASQGTMNNVLLGFDAPAPAQYYETLGGGSGATARAPGASAVQVHMTNTRATDPEVLETRLPGVRLRRFGVRAGSGGAGRNRGGDGLVREYELLAPARLTLLTQRRRRAPFGLRGGAAGRPGRNRLRRAGRTRTLAAVGVWDVQAGDVLTVETPGGGGFGTPD